jgi:hypothetical protein
MLERCSKCILPETYPRITFNEQGVCNYCLTHRRAKCRGEDKLRSLIEPHRDRDGEYDCMVALSGGRDSAFAAHYAAKVLNLRVLACTVDNGFMPEQTKRNVKNTVDLLGIDHVIEKHDYMEEGVRHIISSWIRKPSPAMISFICTGCRTGYVKGLVKAARNDRTLPVITGAGEPDRSFAEILLSPADSRRKRMSLMLGFSMEIARNPSYALRPGCLLGFAEEFFYRFVNRGGKRSLSMIAMFRFIRWNEEVILSLIQNELKWKSPSYSGSTWRSDCEISILKDFLYRETLGFTKHDELLSGMIREEMTTREEALRRLERDNTISQQFLSGLLDRLGLSFYDLDIALKEYRRVMHSV